MHDVKKNERTILYEVIKLLIMIEYDQIEMILMMMVMVGDGVVVDGSCHWLAELLVVVIVVVDNVGVVIVIGIVFDVVC